MGIVTLHSFLHALMITGLVVLMMMMIESLNIESRGAFFSGLRRSRFGGVIVGALLGAVPGCMGGFATVSLYTHGMISIGALTAMMIASCGDEAFVMLAMIPTEALKIFAVLFVLAVIVGILTDCLIRREQKMSCPDRYDVHPEDEGKVKSRHLGWQRIVLLIFTAAFIAWLILDNEEPDERWVHIFFAILSSVMIPVLILASDHFITEHLWHHVVLHHLPRIFCWTFGVLLLIELAGGRMDVAEWINDNTALMILLAAAVGIIPESGPHLIFVTLYASGTLPLSVLLASCISQDGHASLPLLAESKPAFLKAKAINVVAALAAGYTAMLL